jgi:hypothetical protein
VVALVVAATVGSGVFAASRGTLGWSFGGGPSPAAAGCPTPSRPAPTASRPATTTSRSVRAVGGTMVRVYNGSTRRGLAMAVSGALRGRGFTVPSQGNDPLGSRPTTAAVIRYGGGGLAAAHAVGQQVRGMVAFQRDDRAGEVVDLVLGQSFALADPQTPSAPAPTAPTVAASPVCASTH